MAAHQGGTGMAKGWKCGRCSTSNAATAFNCTSCGLIRGSVVVPGSYTTTPSSLWPVAGEEREPEPAPGQSPGPGESAAASDTAPPVWDSVPAAATATPLWRRIPLGWVLTFLIVGGGSIAGLIFNASRSDTGEITRTGDLTAADLRVGDCYDLKDPAADEIDQVTARPCSEEHEFEMIFVGSMPSGAYPDADAFLSYVDANCLTAFEAYIGRPYADSELDVLWLEPTRASWTAGDRAVQCAAYHPRIHRLTGSLKGSNR